MAEYELYDDYLMHHGILGQKWGIRRYQNPDGTLTEAGKKKYAKFFKKEDKRNAKFEKKWNDKKEYDKEGYTKAKEDLNRKNVWKRERKDYNLDESGLNKAAKFLVFGPAGMYAYNNRKITGMERIPSWATVRIEDVIGSSVGLGVTANIVDGYATAKKRQMSYSKEDIDRSNSEAERKRKQIANS